MQLCAVRGAITLSEDSSEAMTQAVVQLMDALLSANQCSIDQLYALQFTATSDLKAENPARVLRKKRPGYAKVPMLCTQEMTVEGMLPCCVRVLMQFYTKKENPAGQPVYLEKAQQLRPDLLG